MAKKKTNHGKGASGRPTTAADGTIITDDGKTGTATAADVDLAASLPATAGPVERKPVSITGLNLLKEPRLLAALESNADRLRDVKGCGDVAGIVAAIHRGVELSLAYPRLAISFARVRQAAVENNRELADVAKALSAAASVFDAKSELGKVLAPFADRRRQARGARKAAKTRASNAAKRNGQKGQGTAKP